MVKLDLKLDAEAVNALLRRAFPDADLDAVGRVTEVTPGRVHLVSAYRPGILRPGGVISGATLMGVADNAAYALVLAHIGPQLMAVSSHMSMTFLRGAQPGDIHAEAELLRLGRRLAVCDIRLWSENPERLAAQANCTYAIPG